MINKNKIFLLFSVALPAAALLLVAPVSAQGTCGSRKGGDPVKTSVINCEGSGEAAFWGILKTVVRIMTGGIGVLAVGAVVAGGILYSMSGNAPERIKQAKTIWTNTIIGLAIFAFFATIINFIIPGGVFG